VIVDASVAAKWFLDEPLSDKARTLIAREDLKAPDIIVPEVLNALRKAVRDERLTLAVANSCVSKIALAIPTISPSLMWAEIALDMSVALRHHVNDCLYLANAAEMDTTLVTADEAFTAAVRASQWADHVTALADAS
jgi:predicted nucleic acid-binding protein